VGLPPMALPVQKKLDPFDATKKRLDEGFEIKPDAKCATRCIVPCHMPNLTLVPRVTGCGRSSMRRNTMVAHRRTTKGPMAPENTGGLAALKICFALGGGSCLDRRRSCGSLS
jgi:hypothetical protein